MADKRAVVRYYIDADVLGLAKVLVQLRPDVTFPGDPGGTLHHRTRPPCIIEATSVKDTVWIPRVAAEGWLIITRDSAIQDNRAEVAAVRDHGARMVALGGRSAATTFAQLQVLMSQWHRIEELVREAGPFICTATRTSLRRIPLE